MAHIGRPSQDLVAYIEGKTGNTYSWNPGLWQVPAEPGYDTTRYDYVSANKEGFVVPLAYCPPASCTNTGGVAWASTNPSDQIVLAGYKDAVGKEVSKGAVTLAVAVPLAFFGPVTLGGNMFVGGASGGGLAGTYELIDTGDVSFGTVAKGTAVGTFAAGLGYGVAAGWMKLLAPKAGQITPEVVAGTGSQQSGFIFRGDGRAPEVIFKEGFQPTGTSTDLYRYALYNESSIFVSTSKTPNIAREFADLQGNGYVYTIRGQSQGLDVNSILGSKSPYVNEFEIAVPGGVSAVDIMGGRMVSSTEKFVGPFIRNPLFK